jgi:HEAT repeat protein
MSSFLSIFVSWLLCSAQGDVAGLLEKLDSDSVETREKAERELLDSGESSRSLLQEAAQGSDERAQRVRRVLRWFDLREVLPPVALAPESRVRSGLLSSDSMTRSSCYFELLPGIFGGGANLQGVYRCALDDPDPAIRIRAARESDFDSDGKAARIALDYLKRVDAPEFQTLPKTLGFLSDLGERVRRKESAVIEDYRSLLSSANDLVQVIGVEGLRRLHAWSAIGEVRKLLGDSESNVASAAIEFLESSGLQNDPTPYLALLRKRRDGSIHYAARALVRLRVKDASEDLLRLALDEGLFHLIRGELLAQAAELDPRLGLSAALEIVNGPAPQAQFPGVDLYRAALEVVAASGEADQLGCVFSGFRHLSNLEAGFYGLGRVPEPVAKGIARAAYPSHLEALLDLCIPEDQESMRIRHHTRTDLMDVLGRSALRWIPRAALNESCFRRLADSKRDVHQRMVALQVMVDRLYGKLQSAELLDILCGLLGDKTSPEPLRLGIMISFPWNNPGLAEEKLIQAVTGVLEDRKDPLRFRLASFLLEQSEPRFKPLLWVALERDDLFPVPAPWSLRLPGRTPESRTMPVRFRDLLSRRLRSPDQRIVANALDAMVSNGPCGLEREIVASWESWDEDLRSRAFEVIRYYPSTSFLSILRKIARVESKKEILIACFMPLIALQDREGLEILLSRDVQAKSWEEELLLRAGALLERRAELKLLDGPLERFQPEALRSAIESLTRLDPLEGDKVLRRVLISPQPHLRALAAELIGRGSRKEFLPALRAMAVTETPQVRSAAILALGKFDRSVWLPSWRAALRAGTSQVEEVFFRLLLERTPGELCPELWVLLRDRPDYEGVVWALALNACAHPGAFTPWEGAKLPSDLHRLRELAAVGNRLGLRVVLSEGCQPWADRPMGYQGSYTGSRYLRRATAREESDGGWRERYFSVVTTSDEVRLLTLDEARAYWKGELEPR